MIEALFNQTNYAATKKMMDATALRHEAIASNIANIETPNYKRIDIAPSFQAELQSAMGSKDITKIPSEHVPRRGRRHCYRFRLKFGSLVNLRMGGL